MARTIKHAAHVSYTIDGMFRVAKRLNGNGDYVIYTEHGYSCYALAVDMARDNGRAVTVTEEAARELKKRATDIYSEWTIE